MPTESDRVHQRQGHEGSHVWPIIDGRGLVLKKGFFWISLIAIAGLAFYALVKNAEPHRVLSPPEPPAGVASHLPPSPPGVDTAQSVVAPKTVVTPKAVVTPDPLPALGTSDSQFSAGLAKVFDLDVLPLFFRNDRMIWRFVTTIDNLPRHHAFPHILPVQPVSGVFLTATENADLVIAPQNSERYLDYLKILQKVDVRSAVDFYIRFYPLFQESYGKLGYPHQRFNDRVLLAIEDLLEAPELPESTPLEAVETICKYQDAALETRSVGQKMMMRIGRDSEQSAKVVLDAFRNELLRRMSSN